jgi:aspartyl-tRNA(Asn)/glutamyl-tRNA(Gln) amidotransferase subunit C
MALDIDTVRRIAHLARLKVPEEELAPLADELSNILTWVEQLGEVDTADVPPMTSVAVMTIPTAASRTRSPPTRPTASAASSPCPR